MTGCASLEGPELTLMALVKSDIIDINFGGWRESR